MFAYTETYMLTIHPLNPAKFNLNLRFIFSTVIKRTNTHFIRLYYQWVEDEKTISAEGMLECLTFIGSIIRFRGNTFHRKKNWVEWLNTSIYLH